MKARDAISKILAGLAEYYDKPLSITQLTMYVEDLAGVEPEKLIYAVKTYRTDPANTRFPLPAKLRAIAYPTLSKEEEAVEAVSRIIGAISHIGPHQNDRAKEAIGELGWAVVQSEGGWQNVCNVVTDDNLGMFRAQWRQLAIAKQSRAMAGVTDAPRLPEPKTPSMQEIAFGSLLKQIPKIPGVV